MIGTKRRIPDQESGTSEADGTRTRNHRIDRPSHPKPNPVPSNNLAGIKNPDAIHVAPGSEVPPHPESGLKTLIDNWASLPEAIKTAADEAQ